MHRLLCTFFVLTKLINPNYHIIALHMNKSHLNGAIVHDDES